MAVKIINMFGLSAFVLEVLMQIYFEFQHIKLKNKQTQKHVVHSSILIIITLFSGSMNMINTHVIKIRSIQTEFLACTHLIPVIA